MATVLVVDDDPANAQIVTRILSADGHRVFSALDSPRGITYARTENPDVILLDVSLVGPMNGLDLCRVLRAEQRTATTPIIVMAAWLRDHLLTSGRRAGCNDYLVKPFSGPELLTVVHQQLARSGAASATGR